MRTLRKFSRFPNNGDGRSKEKLFSSINATLFQNMLRHDFIIYLIVILLILKRTLLYSRLDVKGDILEKRPEFNISLK